MCINAEDFTELPYSWSQAQPCCWIWKQSTLEEAEEPLPDPRERTMAVSELTELLGLTEAGINVFEGIDSNEQ